MLPPLTQLIARVGGKSTPTGYPWMSYILFSSKGNFWCKVLVNAIISYKRLTNAQSLILSCLHYFNFRSNFSNPTMSMTDPGILSTRWSFTRPNPPGSHSQFFRTDMREIANWTDDKPNFDLPWADNMYLAFPSQDRPNWSEFIAHLKQLNVEAKGNEYYKIMYIMRRAHSMPS